MEEHAAGIAESASAPDHARSVPNHASYRATRHFKSLDAVRCLSILAVLWHHTPEMPALGRLGTRGFLGVDMFFVLSGFLIVTLLLRERERSGTLSLKAFYMRRTLRIMPAYYGMILGCTLLFGLVRTGEGAETFFADLPYLLTYTTNWVPVMGLLAHTWSLSAEEQFYLVWPPIQKYVPQPLWVFAALVVISQVIALGFVDPWLESAFGWGPGEPEMLRETTFTPILFGVGLAHLLHHQRGFRVAASFLGSRAASTVLLATLVVACAVLPADIAGWPRLLIHVIMSALLVSCVLRDDHWLIGLFTWKPVVRIGVLSYGMYLFHMFTLDATLRLLKRGMPQALAFFVVLILTYVVAELSFRFYETPFLRLKERFSR